jgi:uncharacterized membrane protein (UPF0127 family)
MLALLALGLAMAGPLDTRVLGVAGLSVTAEVADDAAERSVGLMGRTSLAEDHGMLFVYPEAAPRSFWMKDTLIPLSIAFIDSEHRVIHIADMVPLELTPIVCIQPVQYALEMRLGWFAEKGLVVGDRVAGLP